MIFFTNEESPIRHTLKRLEYKKGCFHCETLIIPGKYEYKELTELRRSQAVAIFICMMLMSWPVSRKGVGVGFGSFVFALVLQLVPCWFVVLIIVLFTVIKPILFIPLLRESIF